MTTILAIDSATGPCSVALWKGGRVAAYLENLKPSAQSAVLLPMIEEALKQNNIHYRDLSHIAATVGPGSFTGIRAGLAAARGIAFSAGIKSLGFTTLEVMAFAAYASYSSPIRGEVRRGAGHGKAEQASPHPNPPSTGEGNILAILNAGKGEYYYQAYQTSPQWQPLCDAKLGLLQDAMASAEGAFITSNVDTAHFPRADALAELAATREASAQFLTPFYIRLPDAKLPSKNL